MLLLHADMYTFWSFTLSKYTQGTACFFRSLLRPPTKSLSLKCAEQTLVSLFGAHGSTLSMNCSHRLLILSSAGMLKETRTIKLLISYCFIRHDFRIQHQTYFPQFRRGFGGICSKYNSMFKSPNHESKS